ncbi:hypothetical protein DFR58_10163 [Anaerobacterium chartisolvens]|uniref:Uncharacterized protein n=1 Tax=Anaerobacterium chartisolvens TaxID=1297424 RepID=A0A369BHH8_9FIRM|nr:hypothetical protein [Anaerobacterium chartisolvens]RCX20861.1 hypothetical protein DFR58_10163 [Anaerobacterium chartisolvens]
MNKVELSGILNFKAEEDILTSTIANVDVIGTLERYAGRKVILIIEEMEE